MKRPSREADIITSVAILLNIIHVLGTDIWMVCRRKDRLTPWQQRKERSTDRALFL
jgi:hypothetical protein